MELGRVAELTKVGKGFDMVKWVAMLTLARWPSMVKRRVDSVHQLGAACGEVSVAYELIVASAFESRLALRMQEVEVILCVYISEGR